VIAPEQSIGGIEWSDLSLFDVIVNAILWVVSRPAYGLLLLQLHLLLQDSQRAEYLADALAARVAGNEAVVGLHERLLLESVLHATVQRATHMRGDAASLFDDLQTVVSRVPDRELERRRRTARLEDARLGSTHPPTAKRIELLEGRDALEPHVVCSAERAEAIDAELRPRHRAVATTLIDNYRDSLYAR
jgi:Zn-dependent protease with chaperone function